MLPARTTAGTPCSASGSCRLDPYPDGRALPPRPRTPTAEWITIPPPTRGRERRRVDLYDAAGWITVRAPLKVELPLRALRAQLPATARPSTPGPGPFSLSDGPAFARLLSGAGFAGVRIEPLDLPFRCGDTPENAASFLLCFGPAGAALREAGEEGERIRPRVELILREALVPWAGPGGVDLPSSALLVTAAAS